MIALTGASRLLRMPRVPCPFSSSDTERPQGHQGQEVALTIAWPALLLKTCKAWKVRKDTAEEVSICASFPWSLQVVAVVSQECSGGLPGGMELELGKIKVQAVSVSSTTISPISKSSGGRWLWLPPTPV